MAYLDFINVLFICVLRLSCFGGSFPAPSSSGEPCYPEIDLKIAITILPTISVRFIVVSFLVLFVSRFESPPKLHVNQTNG